MKSIGLISSSSIIDISIIMHCHTLTRTSSFHKRNKNETEDVPVWFRPLVLSNQLHCWSCHYVSKCIIMSLQLQLLSSQLQELSVHCLYTTPKRVFSYRIKPVKWYPIYNASSELKKVVLLLNNHYMTLHL